MFRGTYLFLASLALISVNVAAQVVPPQLPATLKAGKTHKLEKPAGPLAYRDEAYAGSMFLVNRYPSLPANDLTVERVRATCSDTCILLGRPSVRTVLRDLDLTEAGNKPYGAAIKLDNGASDVLIERVAARNFLTTLPKGYPNRDIIATERTNARVFLRYVSATDATDGCLDLKSTETLLERVYVARCRYGLRAWGSGHATTLHVESNRNANVYIKPGADWSIDRLVLSGPAPKYGDVFQDGTGAAKLSIGWCSRPIVVAKGAQASTMLGPTCQPR